MSNCFCPVMEITIRHNTDVKMLAFDPGHAYAAKGKSPKMGTHIVETFFWILPWITTYIVIQ